MALPFLAYEASYYDTMSSSPASLPVFCALPPPLTPTWSCS